MPESSSTSIIRNRSMLRSFNVRRVVTGAFSNGVRKIKKQALYVDTEKSGWLGKIINWGKQLGGWIVSKVADFLSSIDLQLLAEWGIAFFEGVWYFNWDISDEQIDQQILNLQGNMISQLTGLLGNLAGKIICGGLPTAGIAVLNKAAAIYIARNQGLEALNEVAFIVGDFLRLAAINFFKQKLWSGYKNVRRLIKGILVGNPLGLLATSVIPGGRQMVQAWGDDKVEDWSFAAKRQEARNKLPEGWTGNLSSFWNQDSSEEFWDEFSDSCKDSIIAVAQGLDEFIALQKLQEQRDNQIIEATIQPNGDDGESFTILTRVRDLIPNVNNTLENYRMLENRDMGSYLGQPWDEIPITENLGFQLTFVFYNYEKPPYYSKERRNELAKTQIVLSNVKRNMIDWERLKNDFGKTSPFMKGSIKVTCNLSNGRHFAFYADSESDGRDMCEKLVEYTDQKIVYPIRFANHEGRGQNAQAQYIKRQRMYLAFVYILNWEKINKFEEAKALGTEEDYKDPRKAKAKIIMHYDNKPSHVDDLIREATRSSLELKSTNGGR